MTLFSNLKYRLWNRPTVIFILALALALLAAPLPSEGQQPTKVFRIGWLGDILTPTPENRNPQNCPIKGSPSWQAGVDGLRERGYIQGQNLIIECRWTDGHPERAPALAAELVGLNVDLLVAVTTANVRAAKQVTSILPIVMLGVINPVGQGLVASLAQPGGNVTGLTDDAGTQIVGKYLQLLKEVVPKISRVAELSYLRDPPEPPLFMADVEAAAKALKVTLQHYKVREPEKLEGAFAAMTKARAEALFVLPDPFWWFHAQRIVELAAQLRLTAVYPGREHVKAGGLMAYDVNRSDIRRRIGLYADKIFKGAKPGDLPVEQPTRFDLVINLKTAKTLGLTIPQSLIMQADEVIQ
jgi:putative tryptophan/tyrosine transport system substrate-binding protein